MTETRTGLIQNTFEQMGINKSGKRTNQNSKIRVTLLKEYPLTIAQPLGELR
jgi:hypothetical protein